MSVVKLSSNKIYVYQKSKIIGTISIDLDVLNKVKSYGENILQFIKTESGIELKCKNDISRLKDYITSTYWRGMPFIEWLKDCLAMREMEKRNERIRKGERIYSSDTYSNGLKSSFDVYCKVHRANLGDLE